MRMDNSTQRGRMLLALAVTSVFGNAACNEADGTDPWPGVYPPESQIERPKGGDAGGRDGGVRAASAADGGASEAGAEDAGALDAGAEDGGTREAGAGDGGRLDAGS
jgi:hypothetical protein